MAGPSGHSEIAESPLKYWENRPKKTAFDAKVPNFNHAKARKVASSILALPESVTGNSPASGAPLWHHA